ncbi:MAG: hypothetical protein ABI761_03415 [Saprospiraceae bacterium]
MNQEPISPVRTEDDFNLKALIHKGVEYSLLLWRGKWLIILLALVGTGAFYIKARLTPFLFSAPLTFALNEGDGGNSGGALSGVLGQFGLGGNTGKVSMDKIVQLSKSMRIISKALFAKVIIDGKSDYIANHILDQYHLEKKWAKYNPYYNGFRFKSDSIPFATVEENAALKGVYGFTIGGLKPGLVSCGYNNESSIFTLTATSEKEDLSLALTEQIFNYLSRFYIQQSNDKQKQTYDLVKAKADSLYGAWTSSEYSLSKMDQSQGAFWAPQDKTIKTIRTKQSSMYAIAYAEALKNLEVADYALKYSTPFIREIDKPFAPLDASQPNRLKQGIIGFILGGFLACGWILGKNIVSNALKS